MRIPGVDTLEMRSKVKQYAVDYRPGKLFSSRDGLNEYLRISFAVHGPEQIGQGIERLGKCLESV